MAEVVLSARTVRQLKEIYDYSKEQWGQKKADEYLAAIEKRFVGLGENTLLGRARPELGAGYRSVAEGKHVIFYKAAEKKVVVLAVLHGRMDLKRRLGTERRAGDKQW